MIGQGGLTWSERAPMHKTTAAALVSCCLLVGLFASAEKGSASVRSVETSQSSEQTTAMLPSPDVIARARGTIVSIYQSPTSPEPLTVLRSPTSSRTALVFLVSSLSQWPNWLRVYLPNRPDQSQGWIRANAVTLSSDPYLVRVHLATHRLSVSNGGRVVLSVAIGVGRSVLPTPQGTYFIVDLLKQPKPGGEYGPFAFGLSAYSNVLQSFGGGPGQIGLHGTNQPTSIGSSVSHGCIRVANAIIVRLARLLPLGTRVVIGS